MHKDTHGADSTWFWLEIDGLTPGQEYAFQYLVDGDLRVADPYSELTLHPDMIRIPIKHISKHPSLSLWKNQFFSRSVATRCSEVN